MTDEYEPLEDRILLVESQFQNEGRQFAPARNLDDILTRTNIEEALQRAVQESSTFPEFDATEFQKVVNFVYGRAAKLFLICLNINLEGSEVYDAMRLFKLHGWSNEKLPIDPPEQGKTHELSTWGAPWFSKSGKRNIRDFSTYQWAFLAPVFDTAAQDRSSRDFKRSHVLPFTEKHVDFDHGSFGKVYKYTIHSDHLIDEKIQPRQPPTAGNGIIVAVKEVMPHWSSDPQRTNVSWEREARILQKMNDLGQENIVRFLSAFSRGDERNKDYYLMFEWADGINLRCLWNDENMKLRDRLTGDLTRESLKQILGLAMALCRAHCPETRPNWVHPDLHFRHGDLKPENILWCKGSTPTELGTLKIADWGLAKQSNVATPLRTNNTSTGAGTARYKPPEEELDSRNQDQGRLQVRGDAPPKKRSRLYDVWAMGCITLEFLIWLLYGSDGLRRFNASFKTPLGSYLPFYEVDEKTGAASVHHIAIQWMDHMARDPACAPGRTALGNLLELVRNSLLVVELPPMRGTSWDVTAPQTLATMRSPPRQTVPVSVPTATPLPAPLATPPTEPSVTTPNIVVSAVGDDDNGQAAPVPERRPPPAPISPIKPGPFRALTPQFLRQMEEIVTDHEEDSYWFTEVSNRSLPPGADNSAYSPSQTRSNGYGAAYGYSVPTADGRAAKLPTANVPPANVPTRLPSSRQNGLLGAQVGGLAVPSQQRLEDDWDIRVDNGFATELFAAFKNQKLALPELTPASNLCEQCKDLRDRLWASAFDMSYATAQLRSKAESRSCDLCQLLWTTCTRHRANSSSTVLVERIDSSLRINGSNSMSLSISRSPDLRTRVDENIQIGFGQLPEAPSEAYFQVIKHWLALCDNETKHPACRHKPVHAEAVPAAKELPTRLLDVGAKGDPKVYLRATKNGDTGTWMALSHRWGPKPHFCTTVTNIDSYLKDGIEFEALPLTFRDAVTVTRAVGCRYLWIDSLCIIQGAGGDFKKEAKRMPQVYSGAYCVLASSRAANHYAGFLRPRQEREVVALRQGGEQQSPFYIAENIDDFNGHVLEGDLNSRGWVLQEHALARRTLFFTDHQTYFECGDGVRCETMMTMSNDLAALLGDPNFPHIIQKADRGEMILRYQDLYKRYSQLGLSEDFDRPMAIDGLQQRILEALIPRTRGGFGVFDQGTERKGLLRRSLLWIRREDSPGSQQGGGAGGPPNNLRRIDFQSSGSAISAVPSWSWMAYTGAIDYITPPFKGPDIVAWEKLGSPWSSDSADGATPKGGVVHTETRTGKMALVGEAREFDPLRGYHGAAAGRDDRDRCLLVYDAPGGSEQPETLCVVLGIQKYVSREAARCYLLLVRMATGRKERDGGMVYERVGAGYLPGKYIGWDRSLSVAIH